MVYIRRLIAAAMAALLLFIPYISLLANESTDMAVPPETAHAPRTVKVGISDSEYFSEKQADNSYQGILIDYLQEVSKYAGWNLEYVEGNVDELIVQLSAGEIDLMGCMLKNEYTLPFYDFAEYNSGYSYTTIVVNKEDNRYASMDYGSFQGMRIGVFRKSASRIAALERFTKANNLEVIPVYYDDSQEFLDSLKKGEVDALLANDTSFMKDIRIVAKFSEVPYYFAVTKGKTDLLEELNMALSTILEVNPKFDDIVYQKYFTSTGGNLTFNRKEEAFIRDSPPLKVAVVSSLPPVESYDPDGGGAFGIAPDVLELIAACTGLEFQFVSKNTLADAKQALLAGDVDLISGIGGNDTTLTPGMVFSNYYLNTQKILVKNPTQKQPVKNIAAVWDGYAYGNILEGYETVSYPTIKECIQAVVSGNADYTACNSLLIDHYNYLYNNRNISFAPVANVSEGLSFALAQPANPVLLSILDKAIYSLSKENIQSIVYENTASDTIDLTLAQMLYSNPIEMALIAAIICIMLVIGLVLLFLFMRIRLKLSQQIALQGNAYRIIGELTNEYIFNFDYHWQALILPTKFADLTGRAVKYPLARILNGEDEVVKTLYSIFSSQDDTYHAKAEFRCTLADGTEAWFKAIGTILKDTDNKPLRGIGRITSIQNEKREKQILEIKASVDSLTGLYNRQYSEQKILEYYESHKEAGSGVLLVMDLDFFKTINDTLGHLAGDHVLKEFAEILTGEFRSEDIIGRWGGDEFIAFLCNNPTEQEVAIRAQHLCSIMNREFHYEGKSHRLSISVGIAMGYKASTYTELFNSADTALYHVKNHQRGTFKIS